VVNDRKIRVCSERNPADLPWIEEAIDVVVESTGFFTSTESSQSHLTAGAKRVVISAPTKDDTQMVTPGLFSAALGETHISSNASCTTNATNPVIAILHESLGVKKAMLSTVHAYTSTQSLVDGMATKDYRRGRSAAVNIIPSSTGAAKAVGNVIPDLANVFDGVAIRVPVPSGSLVDLTILVNRETSVQEVNDILIEAAIESRWYGILGVTRDPIVSSDILGSTYGSLVSLDLTQVVDKDLVKVMAWYDNEWSYTSMLMKHVLEVCKYC
jgi:glyceraldehyde 3-phosphate dehydrogenase